MLDAWYVCNLDIVVSGFFSPDCTLQSAITHVILVLERRTPTHNCTIGIHVSLRHSYTFITWVIAECNVQSGLKTLKRLYQLLYTEEQIWYDGCATQVHIDQISVWAHPQEECILCPEWHVEWRLYRSYISYAGVRSIGNLYIAVCSLPNLIIVYYMYWIPPVERDLIPIISQRGGQH